MIFKNWYKMEFSQKLAWFIYLLSSFAVTLGLICTYLFETIKPLFFSWGIVFLNIFLGIIVLIWKKNYSLYSILGVSFVGYIILPLVFLFFDGVNSAFSLYILCVPVGWGLICRGKKLMVAQTLNLLLFELLILISYQTTTITIKTYTWNYGITFAIAWCIIFSLVYSASSSYLTTERQLIKLYEHDELTGLKNRYFLDKELKIFNYHTFAMFDIDFFKKINDTFLHTEGDKILKEFAEILKAVECDEIKVFRYGGEEFLLLSRIDIYTTNEIIKEHIINRVRNELKTPDGTPVTVSCGVCYDERNINKIKLADSYLYAAKFGGRNQVVFNGARIY